MDEDIHELQVVSKYESWELAKKAIEDFQLKTCSQFYVRDSRTLAQAKKTTPRIVEKTKDQLKYMFVMYSCIHGGQSFKSRPTTGARPHQM